MPDIIRIGREPTPAERGLQQALEDSDLLDELAFNLFESHSGLSPRKAWDAWHALGEAERDTWQSRVVGLMQQHVQETPSSRGPEGGPGGGLPLALSA